MTTDVCLNCGREHELNCNDATRTPREYRGWFGRRARRRCPHSRLVGIYGDSISHSGGWRLTCLQCDRYLDGPAHLARARMGEHVIPPGQWDEEADALFIDRAREAARETVRRERRP